MYPRVAIVNGTLGDTSYQSGTGNEYLFPPSESVPLSTGSNWRDIPAYRQGAERFRGTVSN